MADVSTLLTQEGALDAAIVQLRDLVKEVLPERKTFVNDQNYPSATTPYIVFDPLSDINLSGGLSSKPIRYEVDSDGNELYVYQGMLVLTMDAYLGKAYTDLLKAKQFIGNKYLRYKYFLKDGKYGVTDIRDVRRSSVVMDDQKTVQAASMRLTLTYLYKHQDNYGEYVDGINWDLEYQDGDVIENIEGEVPPTIIP